MFLPPCYDTHMSSTTAPRVSEPRVSEARSRLLRVASGLFYRDGIRAVGVDRLFVEAEVTRATFYRHFSGKEALVEAYLQREDETVRRFFADAGAAATTPRDLLARAIDAIAADALENHTRGCPFINAAAEYPDPRSEVRQIVTRHRAWFRQTVHDALAAAGMSDPEERAQQVVLLRDAALVGGYLDGADAVGHSFTRAARAAAGLDPA